MSKELDCPKCPASPMERRQVGNIALEECPRCGGRWYDLGELASSVKDPPAFRKATAMGPLKPRPGQAYCPRCRKPMTNGGLVSEFLRVDQCETCRGAWLDKNEIRLLDTLI